MGTRCLIPEGEQTSTQDPTIAELLVSTVMESIAYINEVGIKKADI